MIKPWIFIEIATDTVRVRLTTLVEFFDFFFSANLLIMEFWCKLFILFFSNAKNVILHKHLPVTAIRHIVSILDNIEKKHSAIIYFLLLTNIFSTVKHCFKSNCCLKVTKHLFINSELNEILEYFISKMFVYFNRCDNTMSVCCTVFLGNQVINFFDRIRRLSIFRVFCRFYWIIRQRLF